MRVPGADSRGHEIELVISTVLGTGIDSGSELSRLFGKLILSAGRQIRRLVHRLLLTR
jgi:hypothetical protein